MFFKTGPSSFSLIRSMSFCSGCLCFLYTAHVHRICVRCMYSLLSQLLAQSPQRLCLSERTICAELHVRLLVHMCSAVVMHMCSAVFMHMCSAVVMHMCSAVVMHMCSAVVMHMCSPA
eukprot:GHVS01084827.1.p2 GENE.GHVS01084827.1~~GHVS01084827.1.p2  ORF type:complete len:118 (+),score=11.91 GHVS01084827.1:205-558(+)